jgi:hypothetical protein
VTVSQVHRLTFLTNQLATYYNTYMIPPYAMLSSQLTVEANLLPSHDADAMHPQSQKADIANPLTTSLAGQLNRMIMKKLQKAFKADPEVDLTSLIPSSYETRLAPSPILEA